MDNKIANQHDLGAAAAQYAKPQPITAEQVADKVATTPVLTGDAVTVNMPTDFQALLAHFQEEAKQKNLSFAQLQLSAALNKFTSLANGQIELFNLITIKTAQLEALNKAWKVTDAERTQRLNKKRELIKALEAAKKELEELSASYEQQDLQKEQTTQSDEGSEARRQELLKLIDGYNTEIGNLDTAIAQDDKTLKDNQTAQAEALKAINDATRQLNPKNLQLLLAAVQQTANNVITDYTPSESEQKKAEEKLEESQQNIQQAFTKFLNEATQELRDEIDRKRTPYA